MHFQAKNIFKNNYYHIFKYHIYIYILYFRTLMNRIITHFHINSGQT